MIECLYPAVHEAVSRVEDTDTREPTVVEEFQPGYVVHGRLLRPAIVRVSMPAGDASSQESMGQGEVEDATH